MLTGSTSGLRFLPALSFQLSCRLSRYPAPFVRGHFAALVPRTSSTSCHPQNTPGSDSMIPMNSRNSNVHLLPSRPIVSANGPPSLSHRLRIPTLSADKVTVARLARIDLPLNTQGCQRTSRTPAPYAKRKCPAQRRRTLLWVMLTAKTPDRAWSAYEELLPHRVMIPHHLLHRLARLLASIKPRTRTVHLRLLSVLKTLERNHGRLRLWEWNTLIDSTGKQWHKTRLEDYENSFDIFNKRGVLPAGNTISAEEAVNAEAGSSLTEQNPDTQTYNILLSIAARSNLPLALRHASSLLFASGLSPDRFTHLCLLRYFTLRNDLRSVCSTLRKMKEQGLEVGLDGINACIWAYAWNGRFDVALPIYRVLRSNVEPTPDPGGHDVREDARYIRDTAGLDVPDGLEPDEISYTMMIQSLAYRGDLKNALSVFVDMVSTPKPNATSRADDATAPACYKPSMAAFRGLFLGFARHGQDPDHRPVRTESIARLFPSSQAIWDQDALDAVFAAFLRLPALPKPTDRVIYWILVAFDKTSGNNCAKLREVWTKLEAKYGGGWGGRLEEIRRSIFP